MSDLPKPWPAWAVLLAVSGSFAAGVGVVWAAANAFDKFHKNPTNSNSNVRFVTWLGDAQRRRGSWIYTWNSAPIALDVLQYAYQRGYHAGRNGFINENPADFQIERSSPDLRLVTIWYEGYRRGYVEAQVDRNKPTLRLRPVRNPYTPPSTSFPVYEYKLVQDKRSSRWLVVELVRNSTMDDPFYTGKPAHSKVQFVFGSRKEAFDWATHHAQYIASRQLNNPNAVRVLDERGACLYAVQPTWRKGSSDPRWGKLAGRSVPWWTEIPCT